MEDESNEPSSSKSVRGTDGTEDPLGQSPTLVETHSPALATCLEDSFFETRRLRKDGWDGTRMASFVGMLAETGIVTLACRACGMSAQSAYALRQRHLLFAKAWEAAISLAREKLADELLARSLKGSAEQLLRDGAIVGERHHFDNKLAFAVLRRLDRRADSARPSALRRLAKSPFQRPQSPATGSHCSMP